MKLQNAENYMTNELGQIDANYYIAKARSLRSEAIQSHSASLGEAVKRGIQSLIGLFYSPKHA